MNELCIELTDEAIQRLDRLAEILGIDPQQDLAATLAARIFDHVDQGISRPDAWERDWLAQIVGPGVLATYDERFGS